MRSDRSPGWHLPSQCEVCRQWSSQRLCADCVGRFATPLRRCSACARPLDNGASTCGDCLQDPPPFARTFCAADYRFPWDRVIADFKFHGRPELAGPLAALMLQTWRTADENPPELLLPIPLSASRLAERGYNQAWELARRLARALDRPALASGLQRVVDTGHQAGLTRAERLTNLSAAFVVEPRSKPALAGRHVALVDDVTTTGATAREAAAVLLRSGVARVDLWVVARTPAD